MNKQRTKYQGSASNEYEMEKTSNSFSYFKEMSK